MIINPTRESRCDGPTGAGVLSRAKVSFPLLRAVTQPQGLDFYMDGEHDRPSTRPEGFGPPSIRNRPPALSSGRMARVALSGDHLSRPDRTLGNSTDVYESLDPSESRVPPSESMPYFPDANARLRAACMRRDRVLEGRISTAERAAPSRSATSGNLRVQVEIGPTPSAERSP